MIQRQTDYINLKYLVTRNLIVVLCLFESFNALSCVCSTIKPFNSAGDLKGYDFIALAEIIDMPTATHLNLRDNGDVKINMIKLFKGNPQSMLYDPSFHSDCAMSLKNGQHWLFFGTNRNGRMEISSCNYSVLYRSEQNERDWRDFHGFRELDLLRNIFEKPENGKSEESIFYPNGKLEIQQSFTGGKLNGIRNIYFPSGKLYVTEDFTNGERKSFRKVYAESGQLVDDISYDKGLKTQVTSYDDTARAALFIPMTALMIVDLNRLTPKDEMYKKVLDSLKKKNIYFPSSITRFEAGSRSFAKESYSGHGKLNYKTYEDFERKIKESWSYYEDGRLKTYNMLDKANSKEIVQNFDQNGNKKESTNGCELCFLYFDNSKPQAASPEAIYLR